MKWIGDRVSFQDNQDSISFVIYPPKLGWKKYLIISWLFAWLLIGTYVISQFFHGYNQNEQLMLFIFLMFWLYFAIRIARTILFLFWGKEYIKLDETCIRIKKATGKYGTVKQYFIENISKLKLITLKETSIQRAYDDSPWVRGTDRIQFQYYGKTVSFGKKLAEKDAELVHKTIERRLEKFLHAKK